jgi:hypothetical protein
VADAESSVILPATPPKTSRTCVAAATGGRR